ncbi:MAG: phosphodiester glycosidase family protein [Phycisphaerales bacterium]|jgi:exopolysaccharide biosynthesis protein|nr:phosphodiester glycosidase family protein [Phycisphaerales bacterium]
MRCLWIIPLLSANFAFAASIQNGWAPIFIGVDHATGQKTKDGTDNHVEQVNAIRVDLQSPGISFYSTPHTGSNETTRQTARQFLEEYDLQVAINTNYFVANGSYYSPGTANLSGLAISDGQVVSPAESGYIHALAITSGNDASFVTADVGFNTAGIYTAVAGSLAVLNDGQIASFTPGQLTLEPRTGMGLSVDGRFLYLITIDGRNPGVSEGGTYEDLARWLKGFGADDGVNFDGGGSTTLVRDDGAGNALLLNTPSGNTNQTFPVGSERYNGNHLGIRATALPEPSFLLPFVLFGWHTLRRVSHCRCGTTENSQST